VTGALHIGHALTVAIEVSMVMLSEMRDLYAILTVAIQDTMILISLLFSTM
jgi:valyl-tRNA synthetase